MKNYTNNCLFVADLHGKISRYEKLFAYVKEKKPANIFIGGDISPSSFDKNNAGNFLNDYLRKNLLALKKSLDLNYPQIFLIPGNDDPKIMVNELMEMETQNLIFYMHHRKKYLSPYKIFGYANVPPTPFTFKDWERYDVSRYVDPGCVSPEEGYRSVKENQDEIRYGTIVKDLEKLTENENLDNAIMLFHTPPYQTKLDRAALDGKKIDHVPLDVHVGSIAVKRFIENKKPYLTLHGHIHESSSITGTWKEKLGSTWMFSAAYDKPELAVITFDLEKPAEAKRLIL